MIDINITMKNNQIFLGGWFIGRRYYHSNNILGYSKYSEYMLIYLITKNYNITRLHIGEMTFNIYYK